MNVEQAKAQLTLAEASAKYLAAKAAYQENAGKKAAFVKTRTALLAARDDWRNNYRTVPTGPGDAAASPTPVDVSLEVN